MTTAETPFLIPSSSLADREQARKVAVLLVLSLVYFLYLDRTGYSTGVQWLAGLLLLLGIMAHSGGFFIHLGLAQKNRSSLGTIVTRIGALLLAAALIVLAIGIL